MKKKLYTLQMDEGKEIRKYLDEYNKIILDMHSVGVNVNEIKNLKLKLRGEFEMNDMGHASRIIGIDIPRDRNQSHIFLSQRNYLEKVLTKYGMATTKSVLTPLA